MGEGIDGGKDVQTDAISTTTVFYSRFSQNCEKRLFASPSLSIPPSVWNNLASRDGFSLNLIFEYFSKICRQNSKHSYVLLLLLLLLILSPLSRVFTVVFLKKTMFLGYVVLQLCCKR